MSWPKQCANTDCGRQIWPQRQGRPVEDEHRGRGLCTNCYGRLRYRGDLIDFARRAMSRDEVMADWEVLRSQGYTHRQAAERLGMSHAAFTRAYERARAAGDVRAYSLTLNEIGCAS